MQLQVLDVRESCVPSNRERENLDLCRRLTEGEALSAQEAVRLLPERSQFVALWQGLRQEGTVLTGPKLPFIRRFAGRLGGQEPFLRTLVCLAVFQERGLLSFREEGDTFTICLDLTRRVSLDDCPYMRRLQTLTRR